MMLQKELLSVTGKDLCGVMHSMIMKIGEVMAKFNIGAFLQAHARDSWETEFQLSIF
jgi:hypothetical protein